MSSVIDILSSDDDDAASIVAPELIADPLNLTDSQNPTENESPEENGSRTSQSNSTDNNSPEDIQTELSGNNGVTIERVVDQIVLDEDSDDENQPVNGVSEGNQSHIVELTSDSEVDSSENHETPVKSQTKQSEPSSLHDRKNDQLEETQPDIVELTSDSELDGSQHDRKTFKSQRVKRKVDDNDEDVSRKRVKNRTEINETECLDEMKDLDDFERLIDMELNGFENVCIESVESEMAEGVDENIDENINVSTPTQPITDKLDPDDIDDSPADLLVIDSTVTLEDYNKTHVDLTPFTCPNANRITDAFQTFINACACSRVAEKERNFVMEHLNKMMKRYHACQVEFITSKEFERFLSQKTAMCNASTSGIVFLFNDVFTAVKKQNVGDGVVLDKKKRLRVKKLELLLKKLHEKIREIEESEIVDWDDNSAYLQEHRFKKRFAQVYEKLCVIMGADKHGDRLIYQNLNYTGTKYHVINKALNKWFAQKKQFPNIQDILDVYRKCNSKFRLSLTNDFIKKDAAITMKKIGKLLQKRRQRELFETLNDQGASVPDPVKDDPVSLARLKQQSVERERQIDELINAYAERQDREGDISVSEDTEESDE